MGEKIKVWLDDYREPPGDNWLKVVYARDAIKLLALGIVEEISLDHDLGPCQPSGDSVTSWIERHVITQGFNPPIIHIHTQNPVARKSMEVVAKRIKEFNA